MTGCEREITREPCRCYTAGDGVSAVRLEIEVMDTFCLMEGTDSFLGKKKKIIYDVILFLKNVSRISVLPVFFFKPFRRCFGPPSEHAKC